MSWPNVASDGVTVLGEVPTHRFARTLDAAGIHSPALRNDFVYAQALLAHHGTSYARATTLLPREKRPYVWALYAFFRTADEFVDNLAAATPQDLLPWSQAALHYVVTGEAGHGVGPVLRAMRHTVVQLHLEPALISAFLEAMAMDLHTTRYETYADLQQYMYGSAEVVGLMMLPLLDPTDPDADVFACLLGEAFQVTNFLRDVADDYARGRVYIPQEVLHRNGADDEHIARSIAQRKPTKELRSALADLTGLNLDTYSQALPGIAMLGTSARPGIWAATKLYRGIAERIVARRYNVFDGRVRVSTARRAALVAPHLAALGAVCAMNASGRYGRFAMR